MNLITNMTFIREKMGMLTILILVIVKGTDGPPVTISPDIEPTVIIINACAGEKKELMIQDELAQGDILTPRWMFSNGSFNATNYVTYCQKESSGTFLVNHLYKNTVEQCNTTSILLKNLSLYDMGYYKLQFLKENWGMKESLPIFLSVSDTPTKQCKPVISHSENALNCSTQCEQFGVEWRLNKGGGVVGNESILLIDCLWKNESILCCLKNKDMECYKGETLDLCAQITPSYCTEKKKGENVHDVHADKAPDKIGWSMLGLLAFLIVPVLVLVIYVIHRKKIISDETSPMLPTVPDPHADVNNVQVPDFMLKLLLVAIFVHGVFLVIVGVQLVLTNLLKYASRRLGSQAVNEPCAVSSNRALNQDLNFNIRDRPLSIPTTQERTCRMMVGSLNPKINKKSRSCGAFSDNNNDACNPVRQTLSLQTLIQASHELGRRAESVDSIPKSSFPKNVSRWSINGPENEIMLQEQYSNVRKNKQISDIQQNPGERLHRLNNFQEDQYSTVYETSLCVYDYARENKQEGNPQTIHGNAEAGREDFDNDYATLQ